MCGFQEQIYWNNSFSGDFEQGEDNSDTKWLKNLTAAFSYSSWGLLRLQAPFSLSSHAGELLSKH